MRDPGQKSPVEAFWELARFHARLNTAPTYFGPTTLEVVPPPAWAFGGTPEQADDLLALVLEGTKTATAGALWDYAADDWPVPTVGDLSIVLDGHEHPRALISTTQVDVVPFDQVGAEHAHLEGEGDRTLGGWREVYRGLFTEHAPHGQEFREDMPVVLQRFEVVYQERWAQR